MTDVDVSVRIQAFERDFEAACTKHHVNAAFVLVKRNDPEGALLMLGGSTHLCEFIEPALLQNSVEVKGTKQ